MKDLKIKFEIRHYPSDLPGSWSDSKLFLKLKGDRNIIMEIEKAIKDALAKSEQ